MPVVGRQQLFGKSEVVRGLNKRFGLSVSACRKIAIRSAAGASILCSSHLLLLPLLLPLFQLPRHLRLAIRWLV